MRACVRTNGQWPKRGTERIDHASDGQGDEEPRTECGWKSKSVWNIIMKYSAAYGNR